MVSILIKHYKFLLYFELIRFSIEFQYPLIHIGGYPPNGARNTFGCSSVTDGLARNPPAVTVSAGKLFGKMEDLLSATPLLRLFFSLSRRILVETMKEMKTSRNKNENKVRFSHRWVVKP